MKRRLESPSGSLSEAEATNPAKRPKRQNIPTDTEGFADGKPSSKKEPKDIQAAAGDNVTAESKPIVISDREEEEEGSIWISEGGEVEEPILILEDEIIEISDDEDAIEISDKEEEEDVIVISDEEEEEVKEEDLVVILVQEVEEEDL